jgi:hypothetical protein
MDDIDPRTIRDLSDSLSELTGTVKYTSQSMQSMLGPQEEANKKIKAAGKKRIEAERRATDERQKQLTKEESLESKQQKLFEAELKARGYKLDATNKEVKVSTDLTIAQKASLEALDKRIAKEKELAEVVKNPVKAFRDISSRVNSFEGVMGQMQEKMFEMTGKSIPMAMGLQALTAAATGVFKAATGMADSLYKGERGAKVGAKAIKELSDTVTKAAYGISAALMFLPGLGWIAKVAGAAIGLFAAAAQGSTKLMEMGAELNDKLYDSFNKLSESGLATKEGMTGVFNTMQKIGLTSAEQEKFNALLVSSSKDLALLGGTAANGLEKYADVANKIAHPTSELNRKLMLLGVTADEQREHTLKYMALQTRMGMAQGKTQADLVKGATAYMEELDRIATLTGISRKEQEDAQKQVMAIEELRAAMYQAEKSGDTKRQKELEAAFKYSSRLMAEGRKKEAAGIAKYYAAGKNVIDEESAKAALTSRGAIDAIGQGKSNEDVYRAGLGTAKEQMGREAKYRSIGGKEGQIQDQNALLDAIKTDEKVQQEYKEKGFKTADEYAKALQEEKIKNADNNLKKNVEAVQIQQQAGQLMDSAAKKFDGAGLAMSSAVKAFNEAVGLYTKANGGKSGTTKSLAAAKKDDAAALNSQQAAMDKNKQVQSDPNATKEQKAAAQKAEDEANKISQKALASKMESHRKEQSDLRELNKKQRIAGKEVYKDIAAARAAGAMPAVSSSGGSAPSSSGGSVSAPAASPSSTPSIPSGGGGSAPASSSPPSIPSSGPASGGSAAGAAPISGSESQSSSGSTPSGSKITPEEQVKTAGLKVRPSGDVYQGGLLTDNTVKVAQSIQSMVPEFGMFTGLNDQYHQKNHPRSQHAQGKGIDFVLGQKVSPERSAEIQKMIEGVGGASKVFDEYFYPPGGTRSSKYANGPERPGGGANQWTTGGHFHIDAARDGGMFDGPGIEGSPILVGNQNMSAMDLLKSIQDSLGKVQKSTIETELPELANMGAITGTSKKNNSLSLLEELTSMMGEKFDDIISAIEDNNDVKGEILLYSKV